MKENTKVKHRSRNAGPGEDTKLIPPNGIFLGASETDIIAIEREYRPRTTSRRKADDPPDRRSG
jgi:hypothetical protein